MQVRCITAEFEFLRCNVCILEMIQKNKTGFFCLNRTGIERNGSVIWLEHRALKKKKKSGKRFSRIFYVSGPAFASQYTAFSPKSATTLF